MQGKSHNKKLNRKIAIFFAFGALAGLVSCGVRGNPQPPLTPPELGHGQPGFKRASEEFAFPNVATPTPAPGPVTKPYGREDGR